MKGRAIVVALTALILAAEQPNRLQRRAHRRGVDRRGDPGGADLVEGDISLVCLGRRIVESRDVSGAEIAGQLGRRWIVERCRGRRGVGPCSRIAFGRPCSVRSAQEGKS